MDHRRHLDDLKEIVGREIAARNGCPPVSDDVSFEQDGVYIPDQDEDAYAARSRVQESIVDLRKACGPLGIEPVLERHSGGLGVSEIGKEVSDGRMRFFAHVSGYRSKEHALLDNIEALDSVEELRDPLRKYGRIQFILENLDKLTLKRYNRNVAELLGLEDAEIHEDLETAAKLEYEMECSKRGRDGSGKDQIGGQIKKIIDFLMGEQEEERPPFEKDHRQTRRRLRQLRQMYLAAAGQD